MQTKFDVIIIGAGPAGSSAAILLSRGGWAVALVEKHIFPRRKVCGECIAASNLPLLDALGIGTEIRAIAGPELRKIAIMHGDQIIFSDLPESNLENHPWGRALGRETLDSLMLEQARLCGAIVFQPCTVKSINGEAGDWSCEVKDLQSNALFILQATVLIAAHGSWESIQSDRPQRRLARKASDLFAFKANFSNAVLDEGLLSVFSFDGGYGGIVLADGGLTTLACCIRRDRLENYRLANPKLRVGNLVELLLKRECRGVHFALQGATIEDNWLTVGPLDPGVRLKSKNDMFRIGNAAGEAHPIIGEGISMALQSAWLLCAQLLNTTHSAQPNNPEWQHEIQRRYVRSWREHFIPRLRLAAAFAHCAMRPSLAFSLIAIARSWPSAITLGAKLAGKVNCAVDSDTIALLTQTPVFEQKSQVTMLSFVESLQRNNLSPKPPYDCKQ